MARNTVLLESFIAYCRQHPDQRFWQALLHWSGVRFIYLASEQPVRYDGAFIWREHEIEDPYNWEGREKYDP